MHARWRLRGREGGKRQYLIDNRIDQLCFSGGPLQRLRTTARGLWRDARGHYDEFEELMDVVSGARELRRWLILDLGCFIGGAVATCCNLFQVGERIVLQFLECEIFPPKVACELLVDVPYCACYQRRSLVAGRTGVGCSVPGFVTFTYSYAMLKSSIPGHPRRGREAFQKRKMDRFHLSRIDSEGIVRPHGVPV